LAILLRRANACTLGSVPADEPGLILPQDAKLLKTTLLAETWERTSCNADGFATSLK
jgi:hypothetical protein